MINYDKLAKRVNVKQLQQTMWTDMTAVSPAKQSTQPNARMTQPKSFAAITSGQHARQLISSQPVHSLCCLCVCAEVPSMVSEAMAQNLSVPIMFVCLLHLANEKQLRIDGVSTLEDLIVSQPV